MKKITRDLKESDPTDALIYIESPFEAEIILLEDEDEDEDDKKKTGDRYQFFNGIWYRDRFEKLQRSDSNGWNRMRFWDVVFVTAEEK